MDLFFFQLFCRKWRRNQNDTEDGKKSTKHEALKKAAELCGEIKTEPRLTKIFNKLRQSLHRSKNAINYLKERNINNAELEIGYNHYQTEYKQLQNCIIFPLKDKSGNIISLNSIRLADCA